MIPTLNAAISESKSGAAEEAEDCLVSASSKAIRRFFFTPKRVSKEKKKTFERTLRIKQLIKRPTFCEGDQLHHVCFQFDQVFIVTGSPQGILNLCQLNVLTD